MKKIALLLLLSVIGISCSMDNDVNDFYYDIIPIESYVLPPSFQFGESYTINLTYKRPTDCYTKPTLYFERHGAFRTVAIQSLVANRTDCEPVPEEAAKEFAFQIEVASSSPYIFKFYKGKDANGIEIYEEVVVPVAN
jgi:hypothetical protein